MLGESNPTILLLEDNEDDVFLMQRAFRKNAITNLLVILKDGQEGIDYMAGMGDFKNRSVHPLPELIILDLKMPRKTGLEFLEWIQRDATLRIIPSILLSSSDAHVDVTRAYELGANTYFVKPVNFDNLVRMVRIIQDYWSEAVKPRTLPLLPPPASPNPADGSQAANTTSRTQ